MQQRIADLLPAELLPDGSRRIGTDSPILRLFNPGAGDDFVLDMTDDLILTRPNTSQVSGGTQALVIAAGGTNSVLNGSWCLVGHDYSIPNQAGDTGIVNVGYLKTYVAAATALKVAAVQNTNYTLTLDNAGAIIPFSTGASCSIPLNSQVPFPIGTIMEVAQEGAGQVTIVGADPNVTLRSFGGTKTAGQWASVYLRLRSIDEWVVTGGV